VNLIAALTALVRPTRMRWVGAIVVAIAATVVVGLAVTAFAVIAYVDLFEDPRQPGWAVLYGALTVIPVIALLRSVRGGRHRQLGGSALLLRVSEQLLLVGAAMIFALAALAALAGPL
jgi:hypothetical protein